MASSLQPRETDSTRHMIQQTTYHSPYPIPIVTIVQLIKVISANKPEVRGGFWALRTTGIGAIFARGVLSGLLPPVVSGPNGLVNYCTLQAFTPVQLALDTCIAVSWCQYKSDGDAHSHVICSHCNPVYSFISLIFHLLLPWSFFLSSFFCVHGDYHLCEDQMRRPDTGVVKLQTAHENFPVVMVAVYYILRLTAGTPSSPSRHLGRSRKPLHLTTPRREKYLIGKWE